MNKTSNISSSKEQDEGQIPNLEVQILPQPNSFTCGPTCLHAVFRHFGETNTLEEIISATQMLPEEGGTLAVSLAILALRRGYEARIYTYNLEAFDPTWFLGGVDIAEKLRQQVEQKKNRPRLQLVTTEYLEFLALGGEIRFDDLTPRLLTRYLKQGIPILTGLNATYLYHEARELPSTELDDIRGEPTGHFVVLTGYDKEKREVNVADPLQANPLNTSQQYTVPIARVVGAIFLGILTHDANLLILKPQAGKKGN